MACTVQQYIDFLVNNLGYKVESVLSDEDNGLFTWRVVSSCDQFDYPVSGNPHWQIEKEVIDEINEALGVKAGINISPL